MIDRAASDDIAALSFEDAFGELEVIVRRLEEGAITLDEAIGAYERGTALRRHCEAKLHEAQVRIDKITVGPNGAIGIEPVERPE